MKTENWTIFGAGNLINDIIDAIESRDQRVEFLVLNMALDKKVRGKAIRWVLLSGIGQAVIRDDVPQELVTRVLRKLLGI